MGVIYARLSNVEGAEQQQVDFRVLRELIVNVYRDCPSIALKNLKVQLSKATGDKEKCAIFLEMKKIRTTGFEPDLTCEMINEELTSVMEDFSVPVRTLIENSSLLPDPGHEKKSLLSRSGQGANLPPPVVREVNVSPPYVPPVQWFHSHVSYVQWVDVPVQGINGSFDPVQWVHVPSAPVQVNEPPRPVDPSC